MSHLASFRTDVRRRMTRYLRPGPVAVCECNAWDRFLVKELSPTAVRIPIIPGESARRVAAAIAPSARVFIVHVDASRTDGILDGDVGLFERLETQGITTINAQATDVRKRTLHERCAERGLSSAVATRDGPPDERLIIKTNLNAAGAPERRLVNRVRQSDRFKVDLSDTLADTQGYLVCTRSEISERTWSDPTLVVERYLENPEGLFYRVYSLGPAAVVATICTDLLIKKLSTRASRREYHFFWSAAGEDIPLSEPPEEARRALSVARRAAAAMHADFHATDCVMGADGTILPIDVNKTPFWGGATRPGVIEHLRLGLEYLVAGGPSW